MKKGFTLIELLAVIVILAIIAVIAAPIVLNIINDSKQSANIRSIDMYKKAVENAIASYKLSFPEDNNIKAYKLYKSYNGKKDFIEYQGEDIKCDIQIYSTGEVYLTACTIGDKEVLAEDSTKENKKYYSVGTETIETHIGEYVNYVATGSPNENVKWRILGVEAGKVMLVSDPIGELTLGHENATTLNNSGNTTSLEFRQAKLENKNDWYTAIQQIEDMCTPYGNGNKVVSVRSLKLADINKITGYNPYRTGDLIVYDQGEMTEYGNIVTYSWNGQFVVSKGTNGLEQTKQVGKQNNQGVVVKREMYEDIDGTIISAEYPNNTVTHTSQRYYYEIRNLMDTNEPKGSLIGVTKGTKVYNLLVDSSVLGHKVWLADQVILANVSRSSWQIGMMYDANVNPATVYTSKDEIESSTTANVRAVVTLDESAKLVYDEENSIWNIQ